MNLGMRGSCERPLQQTFSPNFKHCSGMKFTMHAASKLETASQVKLLSTIGNTGQDRFYVDILCT